MIYDEYMKYWIGEKERLKKEWRKESINLFTLSKIVIKTAVGISEQIEIKK